jgi:ATP-binding cassette subfamily F protein 3
MKMIKLPLWVKMERENRHYLKIIAGQSKPSTGISAPKELFAYLPQHLLTTDGATVMEEASKALGDFSEEDDEINEQLTIRTDYESDAYMKLIERVSDLSEILCY